MYSVASPDVYESDAYRNMGGGGSQSARFHHAYRLWTRNLFEGAACAPAVEDDQRVLIYDSDQRDESDPLISRATWLEAVGLHMTTKYRALLVLHAAEAVPTAALPGSYLYEPLTRAVSSSERPA